MAPATAVTAAALLLLAALGTGLPAVAQPGQGVATTDAAAEKDPPRTASRQGPALTELTSFQWVEGSAHLIVALGTVGADDGMLLELVDHQTMRSLDPPALLVGAAAPIALAMASGLPVDPALSGRWQRWTLRVNVSDPDFTPLQDMDGLEDYLLRPYVTGNVTDSESKMVLFPLPLGTTVPTSEDFAAATVSLDGTLLPALRGLHPGSVIDGGSVAEQAQAWPRQHFSSPQGQLPVLLLPEGTPSDALPPPHQRTPYHEHLQAPGQGGDDKGALRTSAGARAAAGSAPQDLGIEVVMTLKRLEPLPRHPLRPAQDLQLQLAWTDRTTQLVVALLPPSGRSAADIYHLVSAGSSSAAPLQGTDPILGQLPPAVVVGGTTGDSGTQLLRTILVDVPPGQEEVARSVLSAAQLDALGWSQRPTDVVQLRPVLPRGSQVLWPEQVSDPSALEGAVLPTSSLGWWRGHPLTLLSLAQAGRLGTVYDVEPTDPWPTVKGVQFSASMSRHNLPVVLSSAPSGDTTGRYSPLCSGPQVLSLPDGYVDNQTHDEQSLGALLAHPQVVTQDLLPVWPCPVLGAAGAAPPTASLTLRFVGADTELPLAGNLTAPPPLRTLADGTATIVAHGPTVQLTFVPADPRYLPLDTTVQVDLAIPHSQRDLVVARDPATVQVVVRFGPVIDTRGLPIEGLGVIIFGPGGKAAMGTTDVEGTARITVPGSWTADQVGYRIAGRDFAPVSGRITLTASGELSGPLPPLRKAPAASGLDAALLVVAGTLLALLVVLVVALRSAVPVPPIAPASARAHAARGTGADRGDGEE